MFKKKITFKKILEIIFYLISFLLILLPFWFKKKFGVVYFDQLIFHLELFFKGNLVADAQVQKSLYKWVVISSITSTYLYLIFKRKFLKKNNLTKTKELISFFLILILSVAYNTALFESITFNKNDFIEKNYYFEEPINVQNNKKNLILIYVESLDQIFADKKKYGSNLLQQLYDLNINSNEIKNFYQIPGYSFTINSLVATQCGIPAKPIGFFEASSLKNIKNFLPNIKCLGDYTNELNYKNLFITSDEIENFGVKHFLLNHKFLNSNIYDVKKLKQLGYQTSNFAWRGDKNKDGGMHDDVLFEASYDIIKKNLNNPEPFFLSIYTLDTHSPKGYPNPKCLKTMFEDEEIEKNFTIKNSVICTVNALSLFISKISALNQPIDIIILGDHAYPGNDERNSRIFNKFIIDSKTKFNRETMNHLDFFPSLLHILGYRFKQNRFALGFNIFDEINLDFYNEYIFNLDKKLSGKSKKYLSFWE